MGNKPSNCHLVLILFYIFVSVPEMKKMLKMEVHLIINFGKAEFTYTRIIRKDGRENGEKINVTNLCILTVTFSLGFKVKN